MPTQNPHRIVGLCTSSKVYNALTELKHLEGHRSAKFLSLLAENLVRKGLLNEQEVVHMLDLVVDCSEASLVSMTTIESVDCPIRRSVRKVAPTFDGGTYVPGSDHVRYRQRRSRTAQSAGIACLLVPGAGRRTDQRPAHLAASRPGPVATSRPRPDQRLR